MANSKDAADVTETPAGLDVAVTVPGTIVGSHDLQGTDGTTRTDRPGDILGTPVVSDDVSDRAVANSQLEGARADYVTAEVDRANREELPRLGGPAATGWEPGDDAPAAIRETARAASATLTANAVPARTARTTTTEDSGIRVKSEIDRGKG